MTTPHSKLIVPLATALLLTLAALLAVRFSPSFDRAPSSIPVPHNPSTVTSRPLPASLPVPVPHNPSTVTSRPLPAPAPSLPPAERLSPAVCTIIGWNGNGNLVPRIAALKQLGSAVSADDIQALYWFLAETSSPGTAATAPEGRDILYAIHNGILDALISVDPQPADLLPFMLGLFNDTSRDIVTRDYILQHLVPYTLKSSPLDVQRSQTYSLIQSAFHSALQETGSTLPGTAILAMELLGRTQPELFPPAATATTAAALAADSASGDMARTSALQVCASLRYTPAFTTALELTQAPGIAPMLRRAAICTLPTLAAGSLTRTASAQTALAALALPEPYHAAIASAQARLQHQ